MYHGMASTLRAAPVAALALSCTGCAALFGGNEHAPPAVYVLSLDSSGAPANAGTCGTLEISQPDPAPGFATSRMVYQREPHRLEPFAFSRWAEPPAPMVQGEMLEALTRSGQFSAVLAAPAAVLPDFRLQSDSLRVLQSFEGDSSQAIVELSVHLIDVKHARLLAVQRLSATTPASADPAGGVEAANRALAKVVDDLLELTRRSIDCSQQAPATRS
jgi:cholesterol transport system auxiliary component